MHEWGKVTLDSGMVVTTVNFPDYEFIKVDLFGRYWDYKNINKLKEEIEEAKNQPPCPYFDAAVGALDIIQEAYRLANNPPIPEGQRKPLRWSLDE